MIKLSVMFISALAMAAYGQETRSWQLPQDMKGGVHQNPFGAWSFMKNDAVDSPLNCNSKENCSSFYPSAQTSIGVFQPNTFLGRELNVAPRP